MNDSKSTKEQAGKSLRKTFKEPHNSWWRVTTPLLIPFAILSAVLKPSSPVNSGAAIILRIAILCGVLAAAYYFLPWFEDEHYETGQVEVIWRD